MTRVSVSILGSFRKHYNQIVSAAREFEANGVTVNSPALSRIVNPGEPYARLASDPPSSSDHIIQEATFSRIFASDFVYIVTPGGYIGRTTSWELGRIQERGIPIFFSEPVKDLPLVIPPDTVLRPSDLAQRLLTRRGRMPS
jgi:hypothetical protein